jgi:hypothetical protein
MLEYAKSFHDAIGIESPRVFIATFAFVGLVLFAGLGWLVDRRYRVKLQQEAAARASDLRKTTETTSLTDPIRPSQTNSSASSTMPPPTTEDATPSLGAKPLSGMSRDAAPHASVPVPKSIEEATDHYRKTSVSLRRDEIREAYKTICERVAGSFNTFRSIGVTSGRLNEPKKNCPVPRYHRPCVRSF